MSISAFIAQARTGPRPVRSRHEVLAARLAALRQHLLLLRSRLGPQGMAAILLAFAAASLYPLSIAPSLDAIAATRQRLSVPRPQRPAIVDPVPADGIERLRSALADERQFPDRLDRLVGYAGEYGLSLNDGAYSVAREARGQIVRYEVTLPLHGSYPQVRRFLSAVLSRERAVALLDVQFRRAKLSDPALDATVRLAYFMRPAP
ncbi:hypothetical protein AB4Z32_18075 [Massilia sp. 2TAF26]|uniref:hypothetical protein n=1 Tax=Massilia sp. 2TAF26 TaxID=3233012 RepID=UPI003F9D7574